MKVTLKPAEIAAQCNVTSNSIRNWSREFRLYLSEGANATERSYTERDATVLHYISTLKQEGLKTPEIAERLAETKFGEAESVEKQRAPTLPFVEAPQDARLATPAPLVALGDLKTLIEALERSRIKEDKITRHSLTMFGAGFIAALLFVLVIVGIAVLYGGFR